MSRVDHILISVRRLESTARRWTDAGLPAHQGGFHPGGTSNVLVRGPEHAYIELIDAPGNVDTADAARVRSMEGPLSWALSVDDLRVARTDLARCGVELGAPTPGSRITPAGTTLRWSTSDISSEVLHAWLPFLIQWHTKMEPGDPSGPQLQSLTIEVPEPATVSAILRACGLRQSSLRDSSILTDGSVEVILRPGAGRITAVVLSVLGPPNTLALDGLDVEITDRRQHPAKKNART